MAVVATLIDVTTPSTVPPCLIQNDDVPGGQFRQTCERKMQIFVGDVVTFKGLFGLTADAGAPNSDAPIAQDLQADFFGKGDGATFALSIVGAKGRKISKAEGVIVAASGTTYPTH